MTQTLLFLTLFLQCFSQVFHALVNSSVDTNNVYFFWLTLCVPSFFPLPSPLFLRFQFPPPLSENGRGRERGGGMEEEEVLSLSPHNSPLLSSSIHPASHPASSISTTVVQISHPRGLRCFFFSMIHTHTHTHLDFPYNLH